MTTNFPSSIDAFTNPTSADTLDNPPHDQQHADINDAMEAVQAKVGADNSAVTSSLDYRVAALEQVSGRRNLLYNGAMQVAQRGTSATGLTGFSYNTADRWGLALNSVGTYTQSNENDAPAGLSSSLKLTCTTADASLSSSDYGVLYQPLEGQDLQHLKKGTASAESLTLSFWVKSNVTGTYISDLLDQDNSRSISASYSINSSGVWEYKTITFEGDISGVLDNDNGSSFQLRFWLAAGSVFQSGSLQTSWGTGSNIATGQTNLSSAVNNYWQVTGVQLEIGDKATPFEHRSFGEELALCQRYYYRGTLNSTERWGAGYGVSGNNTVKVSVNFPVPMRTSPTALETTGSSSDYSLVTSATILSCSSVPYFATSSNLLGGCSFPSSSSISDSYMYEGRAVNTGAYLAWSAEL